VVGISPKRRKFDLKQGLASENWSGIMGGRDIHANLGDTLPPIDTIVHSILREMINRTLLECCQKRWTSLSEISFTILDGSTLQLNAQTDCNDVYYDSHRTEQQQPWDHP
jgi:hypothetical protein